MIEVLQFLFATAKDQQIYFNREKLIHELVLEQNFSLEEILDALEWFAPIMLAAISLEISPSSVRSISQWEQRYLPRAIIEQILFWQCTQIISMPQREILFDRLSELSLDWQVDGEELEDILHGLTNHLQNYKHSRNNLADLYNHIIDYTVH